MLRDSLNLSGERLNEKFDWSFYLDRMNELHSHNRLIATSLQQKLDRSAFIPTEDRLSVHFQSVLSSSQYLPSGVVDGLPLAFNEKAERKMTEEFQNHSTVHQEKLRRHLTSLDRELDCNRNLLLRRSEERHDKEVALKDLKSEINATFVELERKIKRVNKWKISYEKVHKHLVSVQEGFSPDQVDSPPSPLDGMRRNINRLLSENVDLSNQLQFMHKQLKLFEVKLKAVKIEIAKNRDSFDSNLPKFDPIADDQNDVSPDTTREIGSFLADVPSVLASEMSSDENSLEVEFLKASTADPNNGICTTSFSTIPTSLLRLSPPTGRDSCT